MAGLSPLSAAQWDALIASLYAAECERGGIPVVSLGEISQFGAFFYAMRTALMQQSSQLQYGVYISRFQNLSGSDLDAALAAYNFPRLLASFAVGQVTCTTNSPVVTQIVVPVGATFGTQSGLIFTVIADPTNGAYSQALGGYVISPAGLSTPSTVSVTVQCTIAGTIGNAQPNQINLILAGPVVPIGIGSVTNPAAFSTAIDAESDAAYLARFQAKFGGGQDGGSVLSILATALGVQPGLTVSVADNFNNTTAQDGWVTIVVNELGATTATETELIDNVEAAIAANHTAGTNYLVIGSVVTAVNITATLTLAAGADVVAVPQAAQTAVEAYINSIGLSPTGGTTTLSIAQIYRAIIQSSSDILDVTALEVNSGTVELTAAFANQFYAGTVVLSVA